MGDFSRRVVVGTGCTGFTGCDVDALFVGALLLTSWRWVASDFARCASVSGRTLGGADR
jgi:hypothetical protein